MRIGKLFFRLAITKLRTPSFWSSTYLRKVAIGTSMATGLWFTSTKIFNEELNVFETEDNFTEGEVREIQVGPKVEDTILVIMYKGEIYSTQSKCSHYGFSLAKGILVGDKIICPLHNAGFSIQTGAPDQGPVFDGLKTFPVRRENGKIFVSVPKIGWGGSPDAPSIDTSKIDKSKRIVIIGSGPAALSAAETLRKTGYMGTITMVSKEAEPFDRTTLSKGIEPKTPSPIRSAQSLAKNGIVIKGNSTVTKVLYLLKQVELQSKQKIPYDKLLIATGLKNKKLEIPGLAKTQHFSLRGADDYLAITNGIRGAGVKNVTIIGGGFIGMEIASAIKSTLKEKINVTVLEREKIPLSAALGNQVANVLKELSQKNGVKIVTNAKIKQIISENSKPKTVSLDQVQDNQIATDFLIVAVGGQPAVEFASELTTASRLGGIGGIETDVYLKSRVGDIYAAGDVAAYPNWYTGNFSRIEHFNEAIYQGSVAGLNMMGKRFPMDNIPFFWTRQFNNSLVFTGVIQGTNDVFIEGSLAEMKFIAYYIRRSDDKVLGAAAMGMLNKIQIVNEAMRNGVMPKGKDMKAGISLEAVLTEIKKKDPKCSRCTMCH